MSAYKRHIGVNHRGFSLVELIIVVAVMAIAGSTATFKFKNYQVKSNVERQIRTLAADVGEVRVRALTTKQRHAIILYPGSYVLKSYSSETFTTNSDLVAYGTTLTGGTHNVKYGLKTGATGLVATDVASTGTAIEINQRGTLFSPVTIFLSTGATSTEAMINCLKVDAVRTNIGKQNATTGVCDDI